MAERTGVALKYGDDGPTLILLDPEDGVPWWFGLSADHLFEACPVRTRSLPRLQDWGEDRQGHGLVDPLGTDICGWCQRVWRARNPARGVGSGKEAERSQAILLLPGEEPGEACGATLPSQGWVCDRPQDHDGAHIRINPSSGTDAWASGTSPGAPLTSPGHIHRPR